jgi:hypothetical protein
MDDERIYAVFKKETVQECPILEDLDIECLRCGKDHPISVYGIMHVYSCGEDDVLVGINGHDIRSLNPMDGHVLDKPISALGLNNRTWRTLCYYDVDAQAYLPEFDCIGELLELTAEQLLHRNGFGVSCLTDLQDRLDIFDLKVGQLA